MHGLGARLLAGRDDAVRLQIALAAGRCADVHGFIGQLDVAGFLVGVGIDGDGEDAHFLGRLDDAAGDFTAVGDQDFLEHLLYSFLIKMMFRTCQICRPDGLHLRQTFFKPCTRHSRDCHRLTVRVDGIGVEELDKPRIARIGSLCAHVLQRGLSFGQGAPFEAHDRRDERGLPRFAAPPDSSLGRLRKQTRRTCRRNDFQLIGGS